MRRQLTNSQLRQLLLHTDSRLRVMAHEELQRQQPINVKTIQKYDQREGRLARLQSIQRLKTFDYPFQAQRRIQKLLAFAPSPHGLIGDDKAVRVLKPVLAALDVNTQDFVDSLRMLEMAGTLQPGTVMKLETARATKNPYLVALTQLANALSLYMVDPSMRKHWSGRPTFFRFALLADSIADEARKITPNRVWPVVANLLEPLVKAMKPPAGQRSVLSTDPEHLRKFVIATRRRPTWASAKAKLIRQAGL